MKTAETAWGLRSLLTCGIVASLLFVGTDILAGALWHGYSFIAQSISELSAAGAPTRRLVLPLNLIYYALMIAFGLGVWRLATQNPALRVTALMVAGNAVISAVAVAFFPMHPGEAVGTLANTMNIVLLGVGMLFFLLAMGFGAAAFRNWFRFYSIGTLLAYLVLTILRLSGALPVPAGQSALVGAQERTMVAGYLLWVVMLAIVLLR